ncbi:pyridoxamine 5'-phosphate oxidase family protein [Brevibacillus parabrevis]|uniref:Phosphohydrolase n=1 Tax=Brevibacillus parabrevis TaxID=54914 RepID=A0A4Y3PLS6_BREPA|nr:pyridoxamine 5'-phosphate oxidase family protein [Brevibacillus parabrevis]RNB95696.1 pyridoxamine 5'-phosphate oxidase family protein [Brevibacillus parabrevis]GEB32906.1 phosphohydrolase [Brevibacillus parabrevis]
MSGFGIFREVITSETQLREIFGEPSRLVQNKVITQLDDHCRNYIAQSPFLIISTADEKGNCDASPRGDAPGFVHIVDDHHLVIPERPGNKRMDSITNILVNPHIGLIFLIPTLEETLRINGRACIIQDQDILEKMAVKGKVPTHGIGVQVEECYAHCAKAFMRSGLWKPDTWPEAGTTPDIAKMIADHVKMPGLGAKEVAEGLQDSYKNRLY